MSDPDNFLSRWSRRKLEPQERAEGDAPHVEQSSATPADHMPPEPEAHPEAAAEADGEEPPFDVSSLPSIESITANTDIRNFLKPGVPLALSQAALRRMWSSDPAIRDFMEIAENQWDFTNNSIPGFGAVDPADVPRLLAELMGKVADRVEQASDVLQGRPDTPEPIAQESAAVRQTDEAMQPQQQATASERSPETPSDDSENDAVQKEQIAKGEPTVRPRHGSALPT
jgi:hypothetical protein